jgi:hypothetical protein
VVVVLLVQRFTKESAEEISGESLFNSGEVSGNARFNSLNKLPFVLHGFLKTCVGSLGVSGGYAGQVFDSEFPSGRFLAQPVVQVSIVANEAAEITVSSDDGEAFIGECGFSSCLVLGGYNQDTFRRFREVAVAGPVFFEEVHEFVDVREGGRSSGIVYVPWLMHGAG